MEELLHFVAGRIATVIEAAAIVIIAFGSAEAFGRLVAIVFRPGATHGERKEVWRRFGVWLLLGLEFELAADIIRSVVSPSWQDIGELGAIAVIRTFLNYFLEKDLEAATDEAPASDRRAGEAPPPGQPWVPGTTLGS